MSAIRQAILDICKGAEELLDKNDFLVGADIPAKKAGNLAQACAAGGVTVADAEFLAVIDCTVFGSCKNGVALGENGFYTHNDWSANCAGGFVPWSDFLANGHVRATGANEVRFLRARRTGIDLSGSDVSCDDCIKLFGKLREALAPLVGTSDPAPVADGAERAGAALGTWTCAWCGRSNSGVSRCSGCGAPSSGP